MARRLRENPIYLKNQIAYGITLASDILLNIGKKPI